MQKSRKLLTPQIPSRAIVVLGSFNPAIIQPAFLRRFKILPEQEIQAAEEIARTEKAGDKITINIRRFLISGVATVLVFHSLILDMTRDRLQIALKPGSSHDLVLDALNKLFNVLPHTPVSAIGFNCHAHWKTDGGLQQLARLFTGDSKLFKSAFGSDATIGGKVRFSDLQAKVLFETERSVRMPGGIFFSFNYHYDIADKEAMTLVRLLSNFPKAMQRAHTTASELFGAPVDVLQPEERTVLFSEEDN